VAGVDGLGGWEAEGRRWDGVGEADEAGVSGFDVWVEVFADFVVDAVCPDEDGRRLGCGIVEGDGDDFGGFGDIVRELAVVVDWNVAFFGNLSELIEGDASVDPEGFVDVERLRGRSSRSPS
jgi:hypothetical protein